MPMNQPYTGGRPGIRLTFEFGNLAGHDYGNMFKKFEFQGMVNGGYIVRATLLDPNFNILTSLIEEGYLKQSREFPIQITFQIVSGDNAQYPEGATKPQTAILLSMEPDCRSDMGAIEFIAIDPPSWYLNVGDASGAAYRGRVDQVIKQVVEQYAPQVNVEVGRTVDSDQNVWYMMRQDPKTFISSMIDWSASITQRKTQWLVEVDGFDMFIKEQASLVSKQRAFYRFFASTAIDTIERVVIFSNNALSVVQTKLVTAGAAAISGQYLDRTTDQQENKVFVKDATTPDKQIAKTTDEQSFSKPPDAGPTRVGWTEITAIPEIYSAGDLGIGYDEYIDGRPRAMWLNMANALLRAKFTVLGHGEWSECRGLGVDTVFIKWTAASPTAAGDQFWWTTGNWLIYGFHHIVVPGRWTTDLYCARFDHDAVARQVGGASQ